MLKKLSCFFFVVLLILSLPVSSLAAVNDLMISTSSNASYGLMTSDLMDDDYGVAPVSSIATIQNTLVWSNSCDLYVGLSGTNSGRLYQPVSYSTSNGIRFSVDLTSFENNGSAYLRIRIPESVLPAPGVYEVSADLSSQFSYSYNDFRYYYTVSRYSSGQYVGFVYPAYQQSSGDLYSAPQVMDLRNVSQIEVIFGLSEYVKNFDFTFKMSFRLSDGSTDKVIGITPSAGDYENSVSDSLGSLSSSVDNMSSTLDSVDESLTYISQSQNLVIQGIDNVILHISNQLYAFWDQLYNLIHVPTMAKLDDIIQAINQLDINVNVDIDEIISNATQNSQNEINNANKNHEQLVNGFDNSGMDSDQQKLDTSINDYVEKEDELFADAKDHLEGFTYENPLSDYQAALTDISTFLGGIYNALGALNIPIAFSLTLSIALVMIGYYRFKGGA